MNKIEDVKKQILKVEYFEMRYSTFEKLVKSVYKKEYSFIADMESSNDSLYSFDVNGLNDDYDKQKLDSFLNKNESQYNLASAFLNDLVEKQFLEKGKYLISVCW